MPDITMCKGDNCQIKETCYRYKAKPNSIQSYFAEPPFEMIEGKIECKYYDEVLQKPDGNTNDIIDIMFNDNWWSIFSNWINSTNRFDLGTFVQWLDDNYNTPNKK